MIAIVIYIAAIVAANLSVATFGVVSTPINAFLLIGLDLSLRDRLHERWQNRNVMLRMLGLFLVAGAISYALNPASGKIAFASVAAFVLSNFLDATVYQSLRARPFLQRSNGSNLVGAIVDSLVFPTLAFGALMPEVVAKQLLAKFFGGSVWAYILSRKWGRA